MSGHSKWSTIKHQKGIQDQKRGAAFTKLGRVIMIAAREGGSGDPNSNFGLRLAMEKAKEANMPKENIQRAVDRGLGKGKDGIKLSELAYEAFGPEKVSLIIEVMTDNPNRVVAEIKKILEMKGGAMASPGSVNYLFEKKGRITLAKKGDEEEMMLALIDLGAEDVSEEEEGEMEVLVAPEQLAQMKEKLTGEGYEVKAMQMIMKPKMEMKIEKPETAEKIMALIENLEENDDVQQVWSNFKA